MVISFKDCFKLIGLIVVMFCAVVVCTFFLNFYIDANAVAERFIDTEAETLYKAQMATAKFTSAISGGFLGLIAVVMLVFYIKLYVDSHSAQLGILKAMGYSDGKIAVRFAVFGISIFIGAALGFGCGFILMPAVYSSLSIDGIEIVIKFHPVLLLLVIVPTVVFSALSCGYAYLSLRKPVAELLRGKKEKIKLKKKKKREKERGFLLDLCLNTISNKKALAFFVTFACFCFSAMIQMSASMKELSDTTMGLMILLIGVVLAVTVLLMAITALINGNIKNISIMKAFGYSLKDCAVSVLGGYHIFALIGFAVGTVYQFGLLSLMVNLVYKDVNFVPEYHFNVPVFFITLAVFIVFYEAVTAFYVFKMNKISVKEVMTEN